MRGSVAQRLAARTNRTESCWLWTGGTSQGYGVLWDGTTARKAHAIAWELETGTKPAAGQIVRQTCGQRLCVRPDHLVLSGGGPVPVALEERIREKVQRSDGCWNWTGQLTPLGYGTIRVGGRMQQAHRMVWELEHGRQLAAAEVVRHTCDNRRCCRPDHLLVGSQGDNVRDMHDRDRARKATRDRNGNARLTTEQVEQIRARYVFRKTTYRALAAEFDVHPETVARIVRGP